MRIYTDGAYSAQSGYGGWAWAVNTTGLHASGWENPSTNNRMELMAVLDALRHFYGTDEKITIVSDSQYVVHAFQRNWYYNWRAAGWTTSAGKPVANQDLWIPIINGSEHFGKRLKFEWVKGHSGDDMNDYVDRLAVKARTR